LASNFDKAVASHRRMFSAAQGLHLTTFQPRRLMWRNISTGRERLHCVQKRFCESLSEGRRFFITLPFPCYNRLYIVMETAVDTEAMLDVPWIEGSYPAFRAVDVCCHLILVKR
jgi:hypothetical protein